MNAKEHAISAPETHPTEPVVGHYFAASSFEHIRTEIYFCESCDPKLGYLMVNANNPGDHRHVSAHAIGHTWMEAEDCGGYWCVPLRHLRIEKATLV